MSPLTYLVAVPAYGRDYATAAEVEAAWAAGKDFRCIPGSYINKEDADRYGVTVRVQFCNRTYSVLLEPQS